MHWCWAARLMVGSDDTGVRSQPRTLQSGSSTTAFHCAATTASILGCEWARPCSPRMTPKYSAPTSTRAGSAISFCSITCRGETLYAHLSRIDVRVGQSVNEGDPVGLSGNSGMTRPALCISASASIPTTARTVGARFLRPGPRISICPRPMHWWGKSHGPTLSPRKCRRTHARSKEATNYTNSHE